MICPSGRRWGPAVRFAYFPKDAQKAGEDPCRTVPLTRIHLEEDAGKSTTSASSGLDFNRAGTPLMEIVTEPALNNADEAASLLGSLRQILVFAGVSDADMEKGQMRCDVNVSVRRSVDAPLGAKIELKNINSIAAVRRAIEFEIERQTAALDAARNSAGDAAAGMMRRRDLPHAHEGIRARLSLFPRSRFGAGEDGMLARRSAGAVPELPKAKRARFVAQYEASEERRWCPVSVGSERVTSSKRGAEGVRKTKGVANLDLATTGSVPPAAGRRFRTAEWPEALDGAGENVIESGKVSGGQQGKDV